MRLMRNNGRIAAPPSLARDNALFLDIDGTLADLVDDPAAVRIDDQLVSLLPALSARLGGALALVTGRSIRDVDRLLPGPKLPVAGQHGSERRSAGGAIHLHSPSTTALARLRELLSGLAARHPALRLDDKGLTIALHYRRAPALASYLHRTLRRSLAGADGFVMQSGKMLVEVRPDARDKGSAIRDFMNEPPFAGRLPVFVGDDRTDEHGFAFVTAQGGLSIKVGPGRTCARFRLRDVAAVRRWLAADLPAQGAGPRRTDVPPRARSTSR
jgi:trehalose 6-phosphate phosphatase